MTLDNIPADIWSEVLAYCDRSILPSYCLISSNFNIGATAALYHSVSLTTSQAQRFCDNSHHRIPLIRHLKAFIVVDGQPVHSLDDEDAWISLLQGIKTASALQTLDIMGHSDVHSQPMTTPAIDKILMSLSDLPSLRSVSSKLHFSHQFRAPDLVTCWGTLLTGLTLSAEGYNSPFSWDKTPPHPSNRPKLKALICNNLPSPWKDVEKFFDLHFVTHLAIKTRISQYGAHDIASNNLVDALRCSADRLETVVINSTHWDIHDNNILLPTDFKISFPFLTTLVIFGSETWKGAKFNVLLAFIQCIALLSPSLTALKLYFQVDYMENYLSSNFSWITFTRSLCDLNQVQTLELFFSRRFPNAREHRDFLKHLDRVFSRFAQCEGAMKVHWNVPWFEIWPLF